MAAPWYAQNWKPTLDYIHYSTTGFKVLDEIGKDEEGKPIEVLFGALAMQQWGIRPIPGKATLDMSHYSKDFLEF